MNNIKVYGTRWCGDTKRALKILNERNVSFDWINIDEDKEGETYVKETNKGYRSVPTIVFSNGDILVEPSNDELIKKIEGLGFSSR